MPNSTFFPEPTDPVSETLRMLVKAVHLISSHLDRAKIPLFYGEESLRKAQDSTVRVSFFFIYFLIFFNFFFKFSLNLARYTANRDVDLPE